MGVGSEPDLYSGPVYGPIGKTFALYCCFRLLTVKILDDKTVSIILNILKNKTNDRSYRNC